MPVLNVRQLDTKQLVEFDRAYDELSTSKLEAIAGLNNDATRKKIDDALSVTLGLPDLSPIRELLAREPGLTAHDVNLSMQIEQDIEKDVEETLFGK